MYRHIPSAPASRLDPARRGQPVGRFCKGCHAIYPLLASVHRGKPAFGKDHIAATCSHEGQAFAEGADWWEWAVELLPLQATA